MEKVKRYEAYVRRSRSYDSSGIPISSREYASVATIFYSPY